jgi:hypothetical protein
MKKLSIATATVMCMALGINAFEEGLKPLYGSHLTSPLWCFFEKITKAAKSGITYYFLLITCRSTCR